MQMLNIRPFSQTTPVRTEQITSSPIRFGETDALTIGKKSQTRETPLNRFLDWLRDWVKQVGDTLMQPLVLGASAVLLASLAVAIHAFRKPSEKRQAEVITKTADGVSTVPSQSKPAEATAAVDPASVTPGATADASSQAKSAEAKRLAGIVPVLSGTAVRSVSSVPAWNSEVLEKLGNDSIDFKHAFPVEFESGEHTSKPIVTAKGYGLFRTAIVGVEENGPYSVVNTGETCDTYVCSKDYTQWQRLELNNPVPIESGTPLLIGGEIFVFKVDREPPHHAYLDRPAITQKEKFRRDGELPFGEPILSGFVNDIEVKYDDPALRDGPEFNRQYLDPAVDLEFARKLEDLKVEFRQMDQDGKNELNKIAYLAHLERGCLTPIELQRLAAFLGLKVELVVGRRKTSTRTSTMSYTWNRIELTKPATVKGRELPEGTRLIVDTLWRKIYSENHPEVRDYLGLNNKPYYKASKRHFPLSWSRGAAVAAEPINIDIPVN